MKSWEPRGEYVHHFIIAINPKGQESISLARKEEGNIQVAREEPKEVSKC